jgi:hypothetical protein
MRENTRSAIAVAFALAALCAGGVRAQENSPCDQFKWSVARERGWFAGDVKPAAAGATIAIGQAYGVALEPADSADFRLPPERPPKPGAFGATLEVANIDRPGLYQITLSDEAWLDVVQGGARVKSVGFTGQKDCPGLRKSVRFDLAAGPLSVQISDATRDAIGLAIAPAP